MRRRLPDVGVEIPARVDLGRMPVCGLQVRRRGRDDPLMEPCSSCETLADYADRLHAAFAELAAARSAVLGDDDGPIDAGRVKVLALLDARAAELGDGPWCPREV